MGWRRLSLAEPTDQSPVLQEPISIAELRDQLTLEIDVSTSLLQRLVLAAREHGESFTHRALIARQATMVLPDFPAWEIRLPYGKAQALTSIDYVDTGGVAQSLTASDWQTDFTDDACPVIWPARGTTWPSTDWESISPVTITWQAGYGQNAEDVPRALRHALLLQAARWHEARWDGEAPPQPDQYFFNAISPYILHH